MNEFEMRREALLMANNNMEHPDAVIRRAQRYEEFLKGVVALPEQEPEK